MCAKSTGHLVDQSQFNILHIKSDGATRLVTTSDISSQFGLCSMTFHRCLNELTCLCSVASRRVYSTNEQHCVNSLMSGLPFWHFLNTAYFKKRWGIYIKFKNSFRWQDSKWPGEGRRQFCLVPRLISGFASNIVPRSSQCSNKLFIISACFVVCSHNKNFR